MKRTFAPISVTGHVNTTREGDLLLAYVVTDVQFSVQAQWRIEVRDWQTGSVVHTVTDAAAVPPTYSQLVYNSSLLATLNGCDRTERLLRLVAEVSSKNCEGATTEVDSFLFLAPLSNVSLQDPHIKVIPALNQTTAASSLSPSWDRCDVLRPSGEGSDVAGGAVLAGHVSSVSVTVSGVAVAAYVTMCGWRAR